MRNFKNGQEEIKAFYNAETFDAHRGYANQEKKEFQALYQRFFHRLPEEATVLDLGCGNSIFIKQFLNNARQTYLGVDYSYRQIEYATSKNRDHRFLLADFTRYPFPAEAYDAIVLRNSFQQVEVELRESLLTKLRPILKLGGRILLAQTLTAESAEPLFDPFPELEVWQAFLQKTNWFSEENHQEEKTGAWLLIAQKPMQ